ncbi:9139_t:CDS:2, partial [Funneliformis mosseae]
MSFAEESPPIDISHNETPLISKNKGGKPSLPQKIEIHLTFECQKAEPSVRDFFLQQLAVKTIDQDLTETNIHKKRKRYDSIRQKKITEFE